MVGGDAFTKWGLKLQYIVSRPVLSFFCVCMVCTGFYSYIHSHMHQRPFWYGDAAESNDFWSDASDERRQLILDHGCWVFTYLVYVQWNTVWFCIGLCMLSVRLRANRNYFKGDA